MAPSVCYRSIAGRVPRLSKSAPAAALQILKNFRNHGQAPAQQCHRWPASRSAPAAAFLVREFSRTRNQDRRPAGLPTVHVAKGARRIPAPAVPPVAGPRSAPAAGPPIRKSPRNGWPSAREAGDFLQLTWPPARCGSLRRVVPPPLASIQECTCSSVADPEELLPERMAKRPRGS